jgi:tetratricopeptide (TPR) repeat protein
MSDGAFPDRLAQLKSRWESDPTSRIFLQLAEEYRHQGRVKEALDVLEKGLGEHPGYLSALVAKGRCLLELGEPEGARTVLERVVKQDATQMVANKLLVRAYLDTAEPEKARERLDLYSLLNDSDPDIEELRRRIRAMDQAPQAERPVPEQRLDAPLPDLVGPAPSPPRREPDPSGVFDVFELGGPAKPRRQVEDVFELEPAPPPAAAAHEPLLEAAPEPQVAVEEPEPEDGDVFPGLGTRASRERYLAALEAEGLFSLAAAPKTPAVQAEAPPAPAPIAEPEPALPAEPAAAVEEVFPLVEAAAPWAPAPPSSLEEPPVFELDEPSPWAAEPASLTPEPALPVAAAAFPEPEPPEPEPSEPIATATLGELYLRQGHLEEAERIFREVMRREPDNAAAQAGLSRLASRAEPPKPATPPAVATGTSPLDARSLLAGFDPASAPPGAAGVNARRAFVLRQYLQRIREGSQRHVP